MGRLLRAVALAAALTGPVLAAPQPFVKTCTRCQGTCSVRCQNDCPQGVNCFRFCRDICRKICDEERRTLPPCDAGEDAFQNPGEDPDGGE